MQELTFDEVLRLHEIALERYGGSPGIRDEGLIHSAVAQPLMSFGGHDLYPSLVEKAAALSFSLGKNHGFVDGNKRVALYALSVFLFKNGFQLQASEDDAEDTMRSVADGSVGREDLVAWIQAHTVPND